VWKHFDSIKNGNSLWRSASLTKPKRLCHWFLSSQSSTPAASPSSREQGIHSTLLSEIAIARITVSVLWFALVCLWDNQSGPTEHAGCSLEEGLGLSSCSLLICPICEERGYQKVSPVYFSSEILQITLFCKLPFYMNIFLGNVEMIWLSSFKKQAQNYDIF